MFIKRIILLIFFMMIFLVILSAETLIEQPLGAGTEANPFQISSLGNLRWLSETPDAWGTQDEKVYYLQTANIDASETILWNEGAGFSTIGTNYYNGFDSYTQYFYGNYDGNGFSIKGIYINKPFVHIRQTSVGLFGAIRYSRIVGVVLEDADILGAWSTGTVVAWAADSYIGTSSASGIVRSDRAVYIGGFIASTSNTTIEYCYSTVNIITASEASPGGFVGALHNGSTVNNSYFNGSFLSDSGTIGGFAGQVMNNSQIQNVYVNNNGLAEMSAGLSLALISSSSFLNSFWNPISTGSQEPFLNVSNNSTETDNFPLTITEMMTMSTYTNNGWDFENIWDIKPEINGGLPYLRLSSLVNEYDKIKGTLSISSYLIGNFPNPFNPETEIRYSIGNDENVSITIYNIRGQKVKNILNRFMEKGEHSVIWNGTDENGKYVSSGVYFYQMRVEDNIETQKMILLK
ncbi:MAG: T9SS type A sorting domain-containing protein [Candidatus Cloacimonetes bacterium]|nr:T9SS type A sorting domain-containing protein [Candidatus Cloacimonadota bacterium]